MSEPKSVFDRIDSHKRTFFGFYPLGALWNVKTWRQYFGFIVFTCSVLWILFGFDSVWSQLKPFKENLVPLVLGRVSLGSLLAEGRQYYGQGNHFSAPVIYGLVFIFLSRYLEEVNITKSLNFFSSTCLSLFSIGVFELTWNRLYSIFQGQTWAFTFKYKQVTNLSFFVIFVVMGLLMFLYLYTEGFKPNLSKTSLVLCVIAVVSWGFWVNYPFQVGVLEVETSTGLWRNSNMFPQTYYAVDVIPDNDIAIGEPHHVEDDMIHLVNTLVKVFTTAAIFSVCRVKRLDRYIYKL